MKSRTLMAVALTLLITGGVFAQGPTNEPDWRTVPITNVLTGETVTIADFAGTPILVESFAVWCPTCKRQQEEVARLHSQLGDDFVSISLDVDPNESASMVAEHARSNGFDWVYAVSPPELTRMLIDEFGTSIVAAPSSPIVLVCSDQSHAQLLGRGLKRADKLADELGEVCNLDI